MLAGRRKVETAVLAALCPMMYATHIVREEKGREVCCRDGRQPVELTAESLKRLPALPTDWDAQRRLLGFSG